MGALEAGLIGWALGVALQLQQAALPGWATDLALAVCSLVLLALLAWVRPWLTGWRAVAGWFAVVGAFAALAFAWVDTLALMKQRAALNPALEGQALRLQGRVVGLPQFGEQGVRFRFAVESASLQGQPVQVPERLSLGWWGGVQRSDADPDDTETLPATPRILAGDRWEFTGRLKAPHGHANPHGFDFELWLWEQGVGATGSVGTRRADPAPRWLGHAGVWGGEWMARWRQRLRDKLLAESLDAQTMRARQVVAALVVGDQSAIERADWDIYRATGVAHLMSISGLHITLFAWLAIRAGGWLWRRSTRLCLWLPAPTAARVLGVALAALYAVFSGWGVPAQRTVWMLLLVQGLALTGRRWPPRTVWLAALALVVAMDPWAMLQAGFWLSFVAVGVLMATDGRDGWTHPERGDAVAAKMLSPWHKSVLWLRTHAAAGLREQWRISLALAPLSLLLFQQVSLSGLLANLVAIPWVTLVVTPLSFFGVLLPGAWTLATWAMQGLNALLGWMAAWPWGVWSLPAAPWPMAFAAVLGGLLLVLRWPWHLRAFSVLLVLPLLLHEVPRPPVGQYEVLALDVGQGNAVLVRTASHTLLFDAGPRYGPDSDAGHRVVVPLLRALGERLDVLVLSHSDTDHTGGMGAIRGAHPQVKVISSMPRPEVETGMHVWQRCEQGQAWEWDGLRFEVLHPPVLDYERSHKPNAMSCVLKVSAPGMPALLLTGDIEAAQEARLVAQYGRDLKADVLLVPHHGSKTSSTPEFLQAVSPKVGLVQAGYRNRFGHPAASVVERYDTLSVHLVRSDRCGAWWWRSEELLDARDWCEREARPRYWQHPNLTHSQDKRP